MKSIKLTKGKFAIVDDEDYKRINQYKWYAQFQPKNKTYIACRRSKTNRKLILMHRFIMNCPPDKEVDHKNHNTLENRKFNLRICTHGQNLHNQYRTKNKLSKYKGVCWHKGKTYKSKKYKGTWVARITYDKKQIHLGSFKNQTDAAKAYDEKAKELYGVSVYINFPNN